MGKISDQRATPATGAAARPLTSMDSLPAEPIALVGLSCRLPQAPDPAAFWQLLQNGTDALTDAADRWGTPAGQRRAGFVTEVAGFDARFFGISPHEAAAMDPQQRLVLELAWEALEQAGIAPAELRESPSAVFIGAIANDYAKLADRLGDAAGPHSYTGTHRALIANRVSYFLRLQGPSLTVDTGQSSSLVAVQLACESLRRGESRLALAGGVNLNLLGETTETIGRFGALSPDGRCYTFDERANGYARGEGAAMVVLKRLTDALADGDRIRCVLLGGAINNDGGGTGLTAPSQLAQQQVIERACAQAGIAPADLDYVELHGTGTPVGDPIEAAALSAVRAETDTPLPVGSVKTNIGHLEGAAGIAGLVKVALSLANRTLPASLNFDRPPASIPLAELGLEVVGERRDWSRPDRQLLAGISSFGMGGTNCHLVLAEYRQPAADTDTDTDTDIEPAIDTEPAAANLPWLLSARSATALRAQAEQLRSLAGSAEPAAVALALAGTRDRLEHRAVLLGADPAAPLAALADGLPHAALVTGNMISGQTVLTFPGQGSQWPEMARELLTSSPVFADRISACAEALAPFVDFSLLDVLRGTPGAADFDRVDVIQPALWAVMVSLAAVWQANGVRPDVVIGHSQGEIAAATAIGALSLSDGARVVALRSKAIVDIAGSGGMMSVAAEPATVEAAVRDRAPGAAIAAINGARSVVVSGTASELAELSEYLTAAGYRTKIIPVDYASHSPAVEQLHEQLAVALAPVAPRSVPTTFISTLTGERMDTAGLDADYWYQSLRRPVRFQQAARRALEIGCRLFLESSPHPVLVGALEETFEQDAVPARAVGTLRRGQGDLAQLRQAFAEAYVAGAPIDWLAGRTVRPCDALELPSYPFQRSPHWLPEPVTGSASPAPTRLAQPAQPTPVAHVLPSRTRRQLRELVLATAAAALGHADAGELEPSLTFKELGVDSAIALELRNRLRALTGLDLPTGLLFDHPTPDQLAGYLHELTAAEASTEPAGEVSAVTVVETTATEPTPTDPDEQIAIVSMGCRFPGGVSSPAEFWELISSGAEAIGEFPGNRGWDTDVLFSEAADRAGTSDTSLGGFLHDADQFDAPFFGISPREALAMDPQQRLVLEICWEALEQGGLDPQRLRGSRTGVFVGAMAPDYGPRLHQPVDGTAGHLLTGTALSVVSGRVAYTFGLEGPAVTVDTACSSSLVAIHLAAQALRRRECSLALAGGVTVMSTPGMFVEFSRQGGLAADGRCKAFSADADGTSWAEGAGVLLLERLSDARRNGHPVLAVIRGSAINQDGRSNGMTAPNGPSQERVIRAALADARLDAADVDVVEAHGTGTKLGDPIEAEALLATYGKHRGAQRPLWLGSVKSNIGHTQAAAGVAGVIKMVLAMRHGVLPKTLHVAEPTPHVAWDPDALRLLAEPVSLASDRPARAAVSAFGISGTNGHVIIEATPDAAATLALTTQAGSPLVWVISARSQDAVRAQVARLAEVAEQLSEPQLAIAGQLLAARSRFEHRAVIVAADRAELLAALAALAAGTAHPAVVTGAATDEVSPVFVFPGQGSQWAGMAADLIEASPAFGDQLRQCDEALRPHTGWSVLDVLAGAEGAPELTGSDVIQPALFAVMVSLAALWRSAGVQPTAVLGHSQGELAAACAAGAIELADAARVVALRSRALLKLTGSGGMLAVALPAEQATELIAPWQGRLWPAIFSGPASTVIAGDLDALEEFSAAHGEQLGIRRVAIDYAAHTPHIEALREDLAELLADITPRPTGIEFCSALHGEFRDVSELIGDYWYQGLRHPVRFAEAVLASECYRNPLFIETSPHPVLTGHVQDVLRGAGLAGDAIGSLRRNENSWRRFLLAAAQAFVRGAELDWSALLGTAPAGSPALPGYPFERRRYWIADPGSAPAGLTALGHPLLGTVVRLADTDGYLITGRLSLATLPWLADHAVDGAVLLPGTAFLELAMQAGELTGCPELLDLTLASPLILPEAGAVQLQVHAGGPDESGRRTVSVHSRPAEHDADWTRHATGLIGPAVAAEPASDWAPDGTELDLAGAYELLAEAGYDYGPAFQGLRRAWRDDNGGYVEVALPDPADAERFALHPALLDAALHVLVLDAVCGPEADPRSLLLPFSFSGVRVSTTGAAELRVRIERIGEDRFALRAQDSAGRTVAVVESLALRRAAKGAAPAGETAGAYALGWAPGQVAPRELTGERWAVVGVGRRADELAAELVESGAEVSSYYDLVSAADLTDGEVAGTVVAPILIADADLDDPADTARAAAAEALELLQAWLGDPRFELSRLVLVTAGAAGPATSIGGSAGLAGAAVWGLVRAAAAEHPDRFALIDSNADGSGAWPALAGLISAGEWQLAVRGGEVLVPRLTPAPDADSLDDAADSPALSDGTVLVTGGTGGLGALVAERLVTEHGVRSLLLLSRSGPAASGAAELVTRLRELGAEAEVLACDVSDRAALVAAIGEHRLSGVVHAAGALADAPVDRLSEYDLALVFGPKADAAWHLHELTADLDLAAFVLFSSVAAVVGNAGQASYAAANGFLDGLAAHRRSLGLPATSVAWGLWDVVTGMTGQLAEADVARLARSGVAPLAAERGLALFDQAVTGQDVAQLVAAAWDSRGLRERAESGQLAPVLRGLTRATTRRPARAGSRGSTSEPGAAGTAVASQSGGIAERLAGLAEDTARELLSELIRAEVAAVLGFADADAISPAHAFSELGFDSLTVVDLRNRLDAATGLRLPATLAFDYPTVTALLDHLMRTLAPRTVSAEDSLAAQLAELERTLPDSDPAARGKLIALLHSTLARLEAAPASPDGAEQLDVHEQILTASDDEIFAFIDTQL